MANSRKGNASAARPGKPTAISVMIVEDVDEMRSMCENLLQGADGIRVTSTAASAAEARLLLSRKRPEVVLLDEILPGESSVDLLLECVAGGIVVILMTGVANPTHAIPPEAFSRIAKPGWKSLEEDKKRISAEIHKAIDLSISRC